MNNLSVSIPWIEPEELLPCVQRLEQLSWLHHLRMQTVPLSRRMQRFSVHQIIPACYAVIAHELPPSRARSSNGRVPTSDRGVGLTPQAC